jgi:hypothetical protein
MIEQMGASLFSTWSEAPLCFLSTDAQRLCLFLYNCDIDVFIKIFAVGTVIFSSRLLHCHVTLKVEVLVGGPLGAVATNHANSITAVYEGGASARSTGVEVRVRNGRSTHVVNENNSWRSL